MFELCIQPWDPFGFFSKVGDGFVFAEIVWGDDDFGVSSADFVDEYEEFVDGGVADG